ncbi:YALI0A20518p [Yarrowia lipolytica CLIB122]|uniref:YALI0A20518p n=3 Tax=Yarrowia lipolytica TaxID=4952 RepID=Q6CGC2_YARLI|nr:YALI0A20518p [Yarrowia lipolytica CLIB122]AOW00933.1 hypothetical protein YALI1_A21554g [Yarrowia lipolytica]KAJ8051877.1 hypothetical protein LXG23DRAFT_26688 [Yarrowia lipolytica]CAG84228.1 YALI0A20518p [Yarrowia lipolytica CLIB122]SEI36038.1 YALIA101S09e04566g1_1 [Yarrowia lipolytica]VBB87438.1 Calcium-binding component of the spindle pole body (SPB) half-bridge, putative [Yarrowia lipolytica]|eukprot:XP_500290.1 YALI0A20518p [Yarrowia lipolytica CLIB122]
MHNEFRLKRVSFIPTTYHHSTNTTPTITIMQSARRKQTAFPSRGVAATKRELSADQRQEIQEAFDLFDAHQNRALDFHTLRAAMRALGFELKKAEVLQILDENDTTQQGVMTWEAFEQVMTQMILDRDPLEEVKRAFQLFDEDNTGIITIKNLRKVARELNENIDESELQAMIEEFDLDQDGGINLEEFIAICTEN